MAERQVVHLQDGKVEEQQFRLEGLAEDLLELQSKLALSEVSAAHRSMLAV